MEYLEGYRGRMSSTEDSIRDRKVADARSRAIKHFEQDPSFFAINALEPDNPELILKRIRVINESVLKQLNPERVYSKYIVPHPAEPMIPGTILFGLYEVDWLVTAVTGLGGVHQQATLQKLNEMISIKIKDVVESFPAVVNGVSRLGDGILEMNVYTLPDEMVKIRVQDNELTRSITRNARMQITNKMYTLTKVDTYTDDGVLNWIAKEDLLGPEDIATEEVVNAEKSTLYKIEGADTISRARDYTYSIPGVESVNWSLENVSPDIVKIKSQEGNQVTIRAEKTQLIEFILKAEIDKTNVIIKTIRLVSLL